MNIDQFWDRIGWRPPDSWRVPDSAKDAMKQEVNRRTLYIVGGSVLLIFIIIVLYSLTKKQPKITHDFNEETITSGTLADVVERAGLALNAGDIPKDISLLPVFPNNPNPTIKDGWNRPVVYAIADVPGKKNVKTITVRSFGPDGAGDTDDDYVVEAIAQCNVPPRWEIVDAVNRRGK